VAAAVPCIGYSRFAFLIYVYHHRYKYCVDRLRMRALRAICMMTAKFRNACLVSHVCGIYLTDKIACSMLVVLLFSPFVTIDPMLLGLCKHSSRVCQ
jgi:hypothetical protein